MDNVEPAVSGMLMSEEDYADVDTIDAEDRPKSRIKTARDVMAARVPDAVVDGIAYPGRTTVIVSESGTGKTFVNLDMGSAIADDMVTWQGRRVRHGSVVYHPFQADDLGRRLRALRDHHGRRLVHFYVIEPSGPISPQVTHDGEIPSIAERAMRADLEELAARLERGQPPIVANYFDTVRASMTGSEDNSEHVAAYLRARSNASTR